MSTALTILATVGLGLGVLMLVLALRPAQRPELETPSAVTRVKDSITRIFPKQQLMIVLGGLAGGVVLYVITGLVVLLFAVPAAAIGLPALLAKPASAKRIQKLEAIEAWTRALSGLIGSGVGIEQAIKVSLGNAPAPIRREVGNLVARLNARMNPADAIYAFADELDDNTADVVAAHLVLSTRMRGDGLALALQGLSDTVTSEVRHRREIESDQEKPRTTARNITLVATGALTIMAFTGSFLTGYQTPIGQLLIAAYLGIYVLSLVWMRKMSDGKPIPRLLANVDRGEL